MPARRRAQEAKRAARRLQRDIERGRVYLPSPEAEIDRDWADHQASERFRRALAADPVAQALIQEERERRREQVRANVLRALAVVEADFSRWRRDGIIKDA